MKTHNVGDYLETIYEIGEEGRTVIQVRVAERLGVTRPAVFAQVQRMTRMGLVELKEHEIRLTPHGFAVARDAVRRHRMAERFLTDVLNVPWHKAHEQAVELQSGIDEEVERRMKSLLGRPATCPHGNPIPGTGAKIDKTLQTLNTFGTGARVVLERLTEDVELDSAAMRYFEDRRLMPGARIEVVSVSPDGTMSLRVGTRRASLGSKLADNLWVRPLPDEARRGRSQAHSQG